VQDAGARIEARRRHTVLATIRLFGLTKQ